MTGSREKRINAQKARGGRVVLTTRLRRLVFIIGLVGFFIVAMATFGVIR